MPLDYISSSVTFVKNVEQVLPWDGQTFMSDILLLFNYTYVKWLQTSVSDHNFTPIKCTLAITLALQTEIERCSIMHHLETNKQTNVVWINFCMTHHTHLTIIFCTYWCLMRPVCLQASWTHHWWYFYRRVTYINIRVLWGFFFCCCCYFILALRSKTPKACLLLFMQACHPTV